MYRTPGIYGWVHAETRVQHIEISQPVLSNMRAYGFIKCCCHSGYFHRTDHAAKIKLIGLYDIDGIVGNQPRERADMPSDSPVDLGF
jgi:hypothetical protein